jgi:hypothetical protein
MSTTTDIISADALTPATIEARTLALSTDSPPEQVRELILARAALKERVREVSDGTDAFLKEWIEANGEIEIGDKRWYVGPVKKVKCRDVARAAQCIATVFGISGTAELAAFVSLLASDALKQGAVRKALEERGLPDMFDELFDTTVEKDVQTGKVLKRVHEVDGRFIGRNQ